MSPAHVRILIADDEASIGTYLRDVLAEEGYRVTLVGGGLEAVAAAEREAPHLLITDLVMPDLGGLEVVKRVKERLPETRVLVMTAFAAVETAIEAMKLGALDYLIKPLATDELKHHVRRALAELTLAREVEVLKREVQRSGGAQPLLGDAPAMVEVRALIGRLAAGDSTVLVRGETGTGKELVARALHASGPHRSGPFLAVNCGAIPESLLERELFGNERGAFTGADMLRPGLLEAAADGTLFLDEIGEMPPALQVKLLRVLEGHEFLRLGGTRPIRARVRFVAATNQDLPKAVAERRFRQDLFYRLNVMAIDLPPLRDRDGDIALLSRHFLERAAGSRGRRLTGFSADALARLAGYAWPGNVRELRNVIDRAALLAAGPEVTAADLRLDAGGAGAAGLKPLLAIPFQEAKKRFERAYLEAALKAAHGNISRAAAATGIERSNLKDKLRTHKLKSDESS